MDMQRISAAVTISLALGIACATGFAAKRVPPIGIEGVSPGHRGGGGGVKTGNYNDSYQQGDSQAAEHDSPANDPNNGIEKGVAGSGSNDEQSKAAAAMDAAQKKVVAQFESTQQWIDAAAACDQAKTSYDKARADVLTKLKGTSQYVAAADASTKADAALAELHKAGGATPEQLTTAAMTAMSARTAVTKLEGDACAADPAVTAAKAKLTDAAAAMSQLRQKEHAAVLADADWQAAKEKFDAAKAKTATASQK
jgi:hypothetical protein